MALPKAPTAQGWYSIRCLVCNDHKYKKRGGWKFEDNKVAYNCFNCGAKAVYDSATGQVSDAMKSILQAYQVPEDDINKLVLEGLKKSRRVIHTTTEELESRVVKRKTKLKILELPDHFVKLTEAAKTPWGKVAIEHLREERNIAETSYPFYISLSTRAEDKKWLARLIIPYYKGDKLIFYQGRDLTENKKRLKYLSPDVGRSAIFYGYDNIETHSLEPLYVAEGFFDAHPINGAAILSNTMSKEHIEVLQKCPRKKVVIPDKRGDGHKLALQALKLGWSISIPDIGECKDISEAIVKYGKLYVMKSIVENTCSGFLAQTKIQLLLQKGKDRNGKK